MRQTVSACLTAFLIFAAAQTLFGATPAVPPAFVQNLGQWPEDVLFRADAGAATIWVCRDRLVYQFRHRVGSETGMSFAAERLSALPGEIDRSAARADSVEQIVITSRFLGSDPGVAAVAEDRSATRCSYFVGNDPSRWRSDVPVFRNVVLEHLYPGVDLHLSCDGAGGVACEFEAVDGADLGQIAVAYDGLQDLPDKSGSWALAASGYVVDMVAAAIDRTAFRMVVPGAAQARAVGDLALDYSTFLGGTGDESGAAIAVDQSGCAYVTGTTSSADFPTQSGYTADYGGGSDLFVVKISASGDALVYATYLGGASSDYGMGVAVDTAGRAYVTGFTMSSDYPVLAGYDMTRNDQYFSDVFVTKLSAAGNSLVYSTYLGGTADEYGSGIAVDRSLCVYVTGNTGSADFPTSGGYDAVYEGAYDGFVTKLSAAGSALVYSTFLGGESSDGCYDIVVDRLGYAYVTGGTGSTIFPVVNAYSGSLGGDYDAFVTKLSTSGATLQFSTFLGGSGNDCGQSLAVDSLGFVYVTGYTPSSDFPMMNAFDATYDGKLDAFVTKFSVSGTALVYSTYLGGSNDGLGGQGMDEGYDIAVDALGHAFVTGYSSCPDFPVKAAYDLTNDGTDAFVTELSAAGDSLIVSTYLGELYVDVGYAIALDTAGRVYVTGETGYELFPTTPGTYDTEYNGGSDGFVTKIGVRLSCCSGRVGDVNNSGSDEPTIGDISALIAAKFIAGTCDGTVTCLAEADINQTGGRSPDCDDITIGDISKLIDYLFISGPDAAILPNCL